VLSDRDCLRHTVLPGRRVLCEKCRAVLFWDHGLRRDLLQRRGLRCPANHDGSGRRNCCFPEPVCSYLNRQLNAYNCQGEGCCEGSDLCLS
jgi:hypothetical protein